MRISCACLLALSATLNATQAWAEALRITVEAGDVARHDCPVSLVLPELDDVKSYRRLVEVRDEGPVVVPVQVDPRDPRRIWWILDGKTPRGGRRDYRLTEGETTGLDAPMRVVASDSHIEVVRDDARVLRYNTAVTPLPAGTDPKYKRSGYINPVWTPAGEVVTDRAKDYLHQLGVWLAYVGTSFEGRNPNFWDLLNGNATVQFAGVLAKTNGPVFAGFRVQQNHIDLADVASPRVALKETWQVSVWNVGTSGGHFVYDIETSIACATDSPVTIKKHTWGGMAIRGAPEWYGEKCRFLTSEGKTRANANHTRVRWCDISGSTKDVWSGMTVMSHPHNLRHPEPVRVNDSIPYFCFVDSYLGDFEITPEQPLVLRYRFLVHDGEVDPSLAERVWKDFAHPPVAKFGRR